MQFVQWHVSAADRSIFNDRRFGKGQRTPEIDVADSSEVFSASLAAYWSYSMTARNATAAIALFLVAVTSALAQDGSGVDETRIPGRHPDWEARLAKAEPRLNQPVYLIVHSASDCKFCRRWKGPLAGQGWFERWAREHTLVRLVIIERPFIDGAETESMYPPELIQFFEYRRDFGTLRTGVPLFEAAIGRRIVYRTYGLSFWQNSMFPALKQLEARRGTKPTDVTDEKE